MTKTLFCFNKRIEKWIDLKITCDMSTLPTANVLKPTRIARFLYRFRRWSMTCSRFPPRFTKWGYWREKVSSSSVSKIRPPLWGSGCGGICKVDISCNQQKITLFQYYNGDCKQIFWFFRPCVYFNNWRNGGSSFRLSNFIFGIPFLDSLFCPSIFL